MQMCGQRKNEKQLERDKEGARPKKTIFYQEIPREL